MRIIWFGSIVLSVLLIYLFYEPTLITGQPFVGDPLNSGREFLQPITTTALIGGLAVFVFYWIKFEQWPGSEGPPPGFRPRPTRHFTTWVRYSSWAFLYAAVMVTIYFVIVLAPQVLLNLLSNLNVISSGAVALDVSQKEFLDRFEEIIRQGDGRLDPNVIVPYAVIFVTLIWAGAFSVWECAFRRTLQESALIPSEAQRLVNALRDRKDSFIPKQSVIDQILNESSDGLLSRQDFDTSKENDRLERSYAFCRYVSYQLDDLRSKRGFSKIMSRYQHDFDELKARLDTLKVKLQEYRHEFMEYRRESIGKNELVSSRLDSAAPDESFSLTEIDRLRREEQHNMFFANRYFIRCSEQLEEEVNQCADEILQIVVCGVLAVGKSPRQRKNLLSKSGLKFQEDVGPRLDREHVARAALAVLLAALLCTLAYYGTHFFLSQNTRFSLTHQQVSEMGIPYIRDFREIFSWTFYTLLMHVLGILGGYSIQKSLNNQKQYETISELGRFQWADYIECAIFGFCLNIFLFAIVGFVSIPFSEWDTLSENWPWALVPAVTAAFTGYYMLCALKKARVGPLVVVVQGLVTASVAEFVLLWIYDFQLFEFSFENPSIALFVIYVFFTSFFIGAASGFVLRIWTHTEQYENELAGEH